MSGAVTALPATTDFAECEDEPRTATPLGDQDDCPLPIGRRIHLSDEGEKARWVLSQKNRARAKYRDLAALAVLLVEDKKPRKRYAEVKDALSAAEFRTLYVLTMWASTDLSGSFPSQSTIASAIGVKPTVCRKLLDSLSRKGWIRRHKAHYGKGRQTSNGIQFLLPPGVLPDGHGWEGPVSFPKRQLRLTKAARTGAQMGQP